MERQVYPFDEKDRMNMEGVIASIYGTEGSGYLPETKVEPDSWIFVKHNLITNCAKHEDFTSEEDLDGKTSRDKGALAMLS